jgi:ribonucleoside-diphosphate reductase alpha chain
MARAEIDAIRYAVGHGTLEGAPAHQSRRAARQGLHGDAELDKIEAGAGIGAFDIRFVFNKWTLGESSARDAEAGRGAADDADFDMLKALGFTKADIDAANTMSAAP